MYHNCMKYVLIRLISLINYQSFVVETHSPLVGIHHHIE